MSGPLITGVHALMLGVSEFEPMRRVFVEALEWDVIGDYSIDAGTCADLWHVDAPAEILVLASRQVDCGRIHLFRFPDLALSTIDDAGPTALGFRAMNTYVRDMQAARARIELAGAEWRLETHFDIVSVDGTKQTVYQGRAELPDGAGIVFVMPSIPRWTAAWEKDPSVFCPEATSVVVASPDADASRRFWGPDGLGHEVRYDVEQCNPGTNRMIGLPEDAAVRVVFTWGERTARVEILGQPESGPGYLDGPDIASIQRPGRSLGAIGWVVRVRDLDTALEHMTAAGGRVAGGATNSTSELHEGLRVATVETPEKTWLSVWGH